MQPTNSEKPTELEMWWPSPDSFDDLSVVDTENGWQLSAPDNTVLADWINYWNQDEEHQKFFNAAFLDALTTHALQTLEQHGQAEAIDDEQDNHRAQAEDDVNRLQPEHQPSGNLA